MATTKPAPSHPDRLPIWIRLPKSGKACEYTNLRRTMFNELVLPCAQNEFRPPVESIVKTKPGRTRGVRLVNLKSLLAHLDGLAGKPTAKPKLP